MIKQIILITDGCSNEGISPVIAAAQAQIEQIVVNVVGIVNEEELGRQGVKEIEETARAGGGISRIVSPRKLAQTVQMMTHATVMHTIRGAVNQQLQIILESGPQRNANERNTPRRGTALQDASQQKAIQRESAGMGKDIASLEDLPLHQRAQVVKVMEDIGETADLQVALLVDASSSMRPKLPAVQEAIHDLMLSLQARRGPSEMAVFHFPGSMMSANTLEMDANWTKDLAKVASLFYKLNMRGTTPTGPALLRLIQFMGQDKGLKNEHAENSPAIRKDGILSGYFR